MKINGIVESISVPRGFVRGLVRQKKRENVVVKRSAGTFCEVPKRAKRALESHGSKDGLKHPEGDETPV